jgi:hypothetical protein
LEETYSYFQDDAEPSFATELLERLAMLEDEVDSTCAVRLRMGQQQTLVDCSASTGLRLFVLASDDYLSYRKAEDTRIHKHVRINYKVDSKDDSTKESTIVHDTDLDGQIDLVQYIQLGSAVDHSFAFDFDLNQVTLECANIL